MRTAPLAQDVATTRLGNHESQGRELDAARCMRLIAEGNSSHRRCVRFGGETPTGPEIP